MKLIIVESPTKARTIAQFLGKEYVIESSYGHVRDLPKSKLGIDVEDNFKLQYVTPKKSQKTVTHLKKTAAKADELILATDEDREGEAIAWHIASQVGPAHAGAKRIVFHEITKRAIEEALTHPRDIDMNLVNAQQARRVLDRLVGYKLSPFLWKKIARGLSAGRVQSAALRLIAEREDEIAKFVPQEYWSIDASLKTPIGATFDAQLQKVNGETLDKLGIASKSQADQLVERLTHAAYAVATVQKKEVRKNPLPPFITSTLQQTAAKRFGFSSKKTMFLAQQLYENGHITYMRTDSVNLSKDALARGAEWIRENLPAPYHPESPRTFKSTSRMAQEAHEAIRPTDAFTHPDAVKAEKDHKRIYALIWERFIASQLPQAVFDATNVQVSAKPRDSKDSYTLTANGNIMKFDGFLRIWKAHQEEKELPPLADGDALELQKLIPEEHHTEPPPRYNEASLIKTLEKNGIGRPSTYAPIISVIQTRNYVEKIQGRFVPTEIGMLVNKVLTENFPDIVDVNFTAKMETDLDEVAEGKEEWQKIIRTFYEPFAKHLEKKYEEVSKKEIVNETTDQKCEKCGKPMIIKFGRFGKFMACSGFPDCKNTKTLKDPPKQIGMKCPKCLEDAERKNDPGEVIERRVSKGRARGKIFWGCNKYPACDWASWTNPLLPQKEAVTKEVGTEEIAGKKSKKTKKKGASLEEKAR